MREFMFACGGAMIAVLLFLSFPYQTHAPAESQTASVQATTTSHASPEEKPVLYEVIKVVDGDTLTILKNGKNVTLRLIGLDTPETSDPRKPVQCFGAQASSKAKELLHDSHIAVEEDESQGELDKYGRLLAYVYLEDGSLFNKYMIEEGYGHEYTYDVPYKYQTMFKEAEKNARENKKGMWADNACAEESSRAPQTNTNPTPQAPFGSFDCSKNIYNCTSFKTQTDAQSAFDSCGGTTNDVHKLDSDKDGTVCESLP